jgi:hypothetical protein
MIGLDGYMVSDDAHKPNKWEFPEEDTWQLWCTGYDGRDSASKKLGYATSLDGIRGARSTWDTTYFLCRATRRGETLPGSQSIASIATAMSAGFPQYMAEVTITSTPVAA